MAYQFPPDVAKMVEERMAAGQYETEDDVLRDALHVLTEYTRAAAEDDEEFQATVDAVERGYADMKAGRVRPADELLAEARQRYASEIEERTTRFTSRPRLKPTS